MTGEGIASQMMMLVLGSVDAMDTGRTEVETEAKSHTDTSSKFQQSRDMQAETSEGQMMGNSNIAAEHETQAPEENTIATKEQINKRTMNNIKGFTIQQAPNAAGWLACPNNATGFDMIIYEANNTTETHSNCVPIWLLFTVISE